MGTRPQRWEAARPFGLLSLCPAGSGRRRLVCVRRVCECGERTRYESSRRLNPPCPLVMLSCGEGAEVALARVGAYSGRDVGIGSCDRWY